MLRLAQGSERLRLGLLVAGLLMGEFEGSAETFAIPWCITIQLKNETSEQMF